MFHIKCNQRSGSCLVSGELMCEAAFACGRRKKWCWSMKSEIRGSWKLMLVLAGLPFVAATLQTPEPTDTPTNRASVATAPAGTNSPASPASMTNGPAPADAANAAVVTNIPPAPPAVNLSKGVAEVVRLAQSGVDEEVPLAYVGP